MDKVILHSDLNGFYASVECFSNPEIRNHPVAVAGDPEMRHGIILAKNEIAKKFGIKTGYTLRDAQRLCPGLVIVKPDYDKYLRYSRYAREIYSRYTDQIEPFGVDECWLDVTGSISLLGDGKKIADEIRAAVRSELGITVSVGVSFNKIFSKMGSDLRKPNYTSVVTKENYKDVIWTLPITEMMYVGTATAKKIIKYGIYKIGDLANADTRILAREIGKPGVIIQRYAAGQDNSPVMKAGDENIMKSIGNSSTLPRDVSTYDEIKSVMYMLADTVASRLREHKVKAKTIQIDIRDSELGFCTRQAPLRYPSYLSGEIAEKALEIYFRKYTASKPIRSMGIRATNLVPENTPYQQDLFTDFYRRERMENAEKTMDGIRRRFGGTSITLGIINQDKLLTGEDMKNGSHLIMQQHSA